MTFQNELLSWFQKNRRPLPWRKHYRPYEVWISEIMLQQTQVETVLPYYDRWMKIFPTIESLAKAPEEKVLKAWQGLGYYSRARNLHAAAKEIVQKHSGKFPKGFEAIRALKGVGRYTAGAIASIAFNENQPIVDGNILRVLARVYAIKKSIDVPKNREEFWALEEKLIPKGRARDFNQALMELGALICTKNPVCLLCPLQKFCKAFKEGKVLSYPVRAERKKIVKVQASAVVLRKNGKFLICRRPAGQIMGGLWEFPEWKHAKNKTISFDEIRKKTLEKLKSEWGIETGRLEHLGSIKRNYTHHNEWLEVFAVNGSTGIRRTESAWVSQNDFARYPFSSAHAKIAELLRTPLAKPE